jgi:rubrerythrin
MQRRGKDGTTLPLELKSKAKAPAAPGTHDSPLAQFRCAGCGYGVSALTPPERCPMCAETVWDHQAWRPFAARPD